MNRELSQRHRIAILATMLLGLVAVVAAVTGLNVALGELAVDLSASGGQVLWIVNAYTLTLAALLLGIGELGDRFGRKRILMIGLATFAVANGVSAIAPTAGTLIALRAVAGVGAAMIMPGTLSIITSVFPADQRGRAVGVWAGFAGAGGIIGLYSSALIIDTLTWPWLFLIPVVLSVVAFVMTAVLVPESRNPHIGGHDLLGTVLSILAVGGLVLVAHEGPERGWTDWLAITALVIGPIATVAFVIWERHLAIARERGGSVAPILDVRMFRNRTLASGSLTLTLVFLLIFGAFLVVLQYLQSLLGFSAVRATAGLLPMAAAMMVISPLAPMLARRLGLRLVLTAGNVLVAAGFIWIAAIPGQPGYLGLLAPMMLVGIGLGLAMSPSTTAITESLPAAKQGVASALNDTVREVGSAFGIALIGSLLSAGYRAGIEPALPFLPPEIADLVSDGIGQALAVAEQAGPQGVPLAAAAKSAFADGWHQSMVAAAVVASLSAVVVGFLAPRRGLDALREQDDVTTDAVTTDAVPTDAVTTDAVAADEPTVEVIHA